MARWWEWDEGMPKVPEEAPDGLVTLAVVAWVAGAVALVVGVVVGIVFHAFALTWWCFGIVAISYVIGRLVFKPTARVQRSSPR
jgi:membrane protein YdbS with pleckstrin-like domain